MGSRFVSAHPSAVNSTCHQADDSEKTELPDAAAVVAVLRGRIGIDVAGIGDRAALRVRLDGLLG